MLGDNLDLNQLLSSAKSMMEKTQKSMSGISATGESGAGSVRVTMTGQYKVTAVSLDDDILKEDKAVVETLIQSAMNDASNKVSELTQKNMMSMGDMLKTSADKSSDTSD